jgi:hypothetical protein
MARLLERYELGDSALAGITHEAETNIRRLTFVADVADDYDKIDTIFNFNGIARWLNSRGDVCASVERGALYFEHPHAYPAPY